MCFRTALCFKKTGSIQRHTGFLLFKRTERPLTKFYPIQEDHEPLSWLLVVSYSWSLVRNYRNCRAVLLLGIFSGASWAGFFFLSDKLLVLNNRKRCVSEAVLLLRLFSWGSSRENRTTERFFFWGSWGSWSSWGSSSEWVKSLFFWTTEQEKKAALEEPQRNNRKRCVSEAVLFWNTEHHQCLLFLGSSKTHRLLRSFLNNRKIRSGSWGSWGSSSWVTSFLNNRTVLGVLREASWTTERFLAFFEVRFRNYRPGFLGRVSNHSSFFVFCLNHTVFSGVRSRKRRRRRTAPQEKNGSFKKRKNVCLSKGSSWRTPEKKLSSRVFQKNSEVLFVSETRAPRTAVLFASSFGTRRTILQEPLCCSKKQKKLLKRRHWWCSVFQKRRTPKKKTLVVFCVSEKNRSVVQEASHSLTHSKNPKRRTPKEEPQKKNRSSWNTTVVFQKNAFFKAIKFTFCKLLSVYGKLP